MKIGRNCLMTVNLLFVMVITASAQTKEAVRTTSPKKPRVLVLGVFHMAKPGRDMFNLQVDDVLAPKRQKELSEVAETLKKFQPTKIALESPAASEKIRKEYEDYLAGNHSLTRSESDQIGFRLAKELGHKQVYGIDIQGDFPFDPIAQFAKKNGGTYGSTATCGASLIRRTTASWSSTAPAICSGCSETFLIRRTWSWGG